MDVSGKVVIITGASEGIGRAAARCFAESGAKVVLVARSREKLESLAEELRAQQRDVLILPTDMRDCDAVRKMADQAFEHFGRIDILINNAGGDIGTRTCAGARLKVGRTAGSRSGCRRTGAWTRPRTWAQHGTGGGRARYRAAA